MATNKLDKNIRVAIEFDEELTAMQIAKIKNGTAKKLKSTRRLTEAITKHPDFIRIKDDIISQELKEI